MSSLRRPYVALVQKPKCCAATCLQMVIYRNDDRLFEQEYIAVALGVKVGEKDQPAFTAEMPTMTSFNFDEGISTLDTVPLINDFLQKHRVPLLAEAKPHSQIDGLEAVIGRHLDADQDVWIEYHSQEVHPETPINDRIHDGLIESLDMERHTVVLIDPKPTRRQRKIVSLAILERSISSQYGKELGLVIVHKT